MRTIESNGMKIYELSKGTVIPEYLNSRKQQQLKQRYKIVSSQLEVIHDLTMPDVSTNISVSQDEKYMFVLGAYSPRVRCYELEQLSMKFERYANELPTKIAHISDDYTKFIVLEGEKTLSFHAAGGIYKKVRTDNVVKDLIYSPFKLQLFIPDSKGIITLMDINTGKMSDKIIDAKSKIAINCAAYNFMTDIFLAGHTNGLISGYDIRSTDRIATFDVSKLPVPEYMKKSYIPEICKIAFKDPLKFGVGTDKGMFHLYDIRNNSKPFSSRDLDYEFPIKNIIFHEEKVIAAVKNVFKIWEPIENDEGKIIATYDTNTTINDFFQFPNSGLFFAATNEPQISTYFIPRIADAPSWCQKLSNLIVDVEAESQSMYDTHMFITREEVDELFLGHLIGTSSLRAYMHGYYISNETYKRSKNAQQAIKNKVENSVKEIIVENDKVEQVDDIPDPSMNVALKSLIKDDRYQDLFACEEFTLNTNCKAFEQVKIDMKHLEKKRKKKLLLKSQAKKSKLIANGEVSGDDSDVNSD